MPHLVNIGTSTADLRAQSELVGKLRGDLEQRLAAFHKAPSYRKVDEARFVMAAVFEMLHAQAAFNAGVVGAIAELRKPAT
jgi:predicted lipid-binding transport protein (Tim44 family)